MRKQFFQIQGALLFVSMIATIHAQTAAGSASPDRVAESEEYLASEKMAFIEAPTAHVFVASKESITSGADLELTDAQLEKIFEYKDQFELSTASKRAERDSMMRKIANLINQPMQIDRNEVLKLNDKISAINAELSTAHLNYWLSMTSELTPDQRKQMRHAMLVREVGHCGPAGPGLYPGGPSGGMLPFGPPPPFHTFMMFGPPSMAPFPPPPATQGQHP